jgi:D-methionine transport system substrate-binding protein
MKKYFSLVLSLILTLGLFGCGNSGSPKEEEGKQEESKKTIVVGATPVPHMEILKEVKPLLEKEGYELELLEFTDYVTPNTALAEGELDANFFQHTPYLNKFNEEKELDLECAVKVHIEPMGLYSKKIKNLDEIQDGAVIAIPNDPTNGSRALRLLEKNNIIMLKEGELVSALDITDNPKNIKFEELDAPQLPRVLQEVDASVINTNYALEADLNPVKDAIVIEDKDSPYANILAIRKEDKEKPAIKALLKVLNSPEIKKFIEENYKGSIVPAF